MGRHQRPQCRVRAEEGVDGLLVRVQVEQSPAALHRGGEVSEVLQSQRAEHVTGPGAQRDHAGAVRQRQ